MTEVIEKSGTDLDVDSELAEVGHEKRTGRRLSVSFRTLLVSTVFLALTVAVASLSWLYIGRGTELTAQEKRTQDYRHAEDIALKYAVNAAAMDFHDLNTWKLKLVDGTSQPLKDKLTKAAASMEQLLIPLEWNSSADPLTAKVRSESNGVYVLDTFVSVLTRTTQAPDGLQSTATYSITVDSNANWQITDVGGIGAVSGGK
ncbi:Uncharacterised protein [Mycobacteroides abscessus subsp. bolletii]|uniref:hypothetical protein n=1 Tax=Mycobacteroides abscessus TaxID=36809 RepID=UPI00092AFBA6|nr:hypothetical protein [Mycobacteroides abscessus]SHX53129.1 Uncharacterised protein [Mycobacteroides abscessus subsp. bolletii]SKP62030.1 Uncharacterised protein [Mycobacteroides abscessus subsp. bolletii]SKP73839.1 Uncharacterised protein [Mycobacteroides abscessus subsp. bolletii]SKQ21045.1 Uncharacterised protein [Mycobacteroides abscessus subsp. bolletii]